MGSIHFFIPRHPELNANALDCAYMVGTDGVPWESGVRLSDNRLIVTRDTSESGRFVVLWNVEGHGRLALSTGTLAPGVRPYHLPLELARGCLARLQSQLNTAEVRGYHLGEQARQLLQQAIGHFVSAALAQDDLERSADEANRSLTHCLNLTALMGQNDRVISITDPHSGAASVWGAVVRDAHEANKLASLAQPVPNVAMMRQSWCDLEVNPGEWSWDGLDKMLKCVDTDRIRVGYGPLVTFDRNQLPDWLYLWEDDFDAIHSYVVAYVRQVVARYIGQFRFWLCTAGTNVDEALNLTEEQRLRLTVNVVETVRRGDSRTPALISVKQPWGEYLGRTTFDLTPLQFADILVRGDLGLSAIGLQIDINCLPGYTLPRDLLEFNCMIDSWSQLGLPLVIFLSVPSIDQDQLGHGLRPEVIEQLLHLLSRKTAVHGVVWDPLIARTDSRGGLLASDGQPRPIFESFRNAAAGRRR